MLTAEMQAEVLVRHLRDAHSVRKIARDLGINRKSVDSVVERRAVKERVERGQRSSILDDFKPQIRALLADDNRLPSTVIMQRLRAAGYSGGYSTVKAWVAEHRPRGSQPKHEAFLMLEFDAGQCAQVDWGVFGDVFGNGGRIYCFVMVLCYSRRIYIEFTRSDKFEDFIRCHEHALLFFGGCPEEVWYDNLASAVSERRGKLVRFNARFFAYAGYRGFRPYACNKGRGNEKGRVEDGIKYIRENFWPGRHFADFHDLCEQARIWNHEIANRREHRSTRRIPELVFAAEEHAKLDALRPERYDTDEIFTKEVPPNFHVTYQTNRYSIPWTLVGQVVTIRICDQQIRIAYNERQVAAHNRSYDKYQTFTKDEHKSGLLDIKPGAKDTRTWQIDVLKSMGPELAQYLDFLGASPRSLRYELSKLLALGTVYGKDALRQVIAAFLAKGIIGSDQIELALKSSGIPQAKPAPLTFKQEQLARIPLQVDLRRYDALLLTSNHANHDDKEEHSSSEAINHNTEATIQTD